MGALNDTPRLPVVDQVESRDSTLAYDSKIINGLVEKSQSAMRALKRGGLQVAFQGVVGKGQGLTDYNGTLFGVSGDFLNQYQSGSGSLQLVTSSGGFPARDGAAQVGFLGKLWVIGGNTNSGITNDAWNSVTGSTWTQNTTIPTTVTNRTNAKAVVLNNVLYVMGGWDGVSVYYNDVWQTTDGLTWTQTTAHAAWGPRADFEVFSFGGSIYLAGGQGTPSPNGYPSNGQWHDVWTSTNGSAWQVQNPECPWIGRRRFGFFMTGSTMNVLGGFIGMSTNTTHQNAVSDQWQSTDLGVTWTRINTNVFGVAASPMDPIGVVTSLGRSASYGRPLTVVNGAGGSGAAAQTYAHYNGSVYDFEMPVARVLDTITFTTVGSGYTTACTVTDPGDGASVPIVGYGFLDGTSTQGGRGGEVVFANNTYWYFTTYINGAQKNEIWTSANGTAWTLLTAAPGYANRSMQVFVYGNIWIIGGFSTAANTYYSDVWDIAGGSGSFALTPTVAGEFYWFNQTSQSLTTPLLVFISAHQGYTFNASLGVLTKITNANYPPVTVAGIVYLDTTFYVMDPQGRIWGSNLNDPLTWTALNQIAIQNEPNGGVGLAKVGTYLLAFGQWTCQFFYDAANPPPGSPLSPNVSLQYQVGCANGRTIIEMQGTVVFVGQTKAEGSKVYMMQGYAPQVISTPFIDKILEADPLTNVNAFCTSQFGHPCYILTLLSLGVTLCYDFWSQFWTVWTSATPNDAVSITSLTVTGVSSAQFAQLVASTAPSQHGLADGDPVIISGQGPANYNGNFVANVQSPTQFSFIVSSNQGNTTGGQVQGWSYGPFTPVTAHEVSPGNLFYMQDPTNGKVYLVTYTTGSDYGNPVDFHVVTPRWDNGVLRKKTVVRLSLVGDATSSNVWVRHTETDYKTWSYFRPINMNASWPFIAALGQVSRQAYELRHTDFTQQRLEAIEVEYEMGV